MEKGRIADVIRKSRDQNRELMSSQVGKSSFNTVENPTPLSAGDHNMLTNLQYLNENEQQESSNVA